MTALATAAREMHEMMAALSAHETAAAAEASRLKEEIRKRREVLNFAQDGIDHAKVALAKSIIEVRGQYSRGGADRASCVSDAIKQVATGKPLGAYVDLLRQFFGTKNYDRWIGQRCDCEYGYGPRHGSIVFAIGFTAAVRKREPFELTDDEAEAAIYYLVNLERIQAAEAASKAA